MPPRLSNTSRSRKPRSLASLRRSARACRACPLWEKATQTVFGEGPDDAKFMVIGEQAGDREDREGEPFVGPAGGLLDKALDEVGISRAAIYVTNVVKHFKFELRGKRRIHKRANAAEIEACLQWLDAELESVAPRYVVCLGALAARTMLGASFRLMEDRGKWLEIGEGRWCLATVHPSFVLRARAAGDYEAAYRSFVGDLAQMKCLPAS